MTTATPPIRGALSHTTSLPRYAPLAVFAGSVGLAALVLLLTWFSIPGLVALSVIVYIVAITVMSQAVEGRRKATDRLVTTVVYVAFGLAMLPLVWLCVIVIQNGSHRLSGYFLTHSMSGVFGGNVSGGAYHAIIGTLLVTLVAALISVPIGLLAAIYLVEYSRGGKLSRALTFFVDVMTGIPSIVAGLFAYALFVIFFGPGVRMGLAGSVALSILMLPVVVRSAEEMLKIVPNELREASYALGVPKWRTILKVVLPTTAAGLVAGVTLAIARVIGETAPLILVLGISAESIKSNVFANEQMMTLPVFIYSQYRQGDAICTPGLPFECSTSINYDRAWSAALTLIILVMLLNLVARLIGRIFAPKTNRR